MSNPSIEDYTIGWICALQEEYDAAARMLDAEFDGPDTADVNDNSSYVYGCISGHNVVLGCLPGGQYGTNSAASVARDMVRSFPKLRFALMVGIGGGAPTAGKDIRLGDVVVSQPQGKLGGVVQYDLGKRLPGGRFEQSGQLNGPPQVVLGVLPEMRRLHNDSRKPDRIAEHVKLMDEEPDYQRPDDDRLYRADYPHQGGEDCSKCETCEVVQRPPRSSNRVVTVHYGTIASANSVMKNAKDRDEYAQDPALNVLCFEMEAAGLMNSFPCLVIRGICDYSDSHKNDQWHNYAALAAAAYARELLYILKPQKVHGAPSWAGKMEERVDDLICQNRDQADETILNCITKIDHGSYHSDIANKRQPGTGQWILESGKFQTWLKTSKQTLFCTGAPGAGKTILTSVVVEHLTTRSQNDRNIGVAYLYCNYNRQNEQQLNCLLECLLKQLAERRGSVPECVKSLYNCLRAEHMRPSVGQLSSALDAVVSLYSKVFIVIDALDECRDTDGSRAELLVETVRALQKPYGVNIFETLALETSSNSNKYLKRKKRGNNDTSARGNSTGIPKAKEEKKGEKSWRSSLLLISLVGHWQLVDGGRSAAEPFSGLHIARYTARINPRVPKILVNPRDKAANPSIKAAAILSTMRNRRRDTD
ncbi:Ankyrin repeat protein [Metarhizium robertsii ARSEF 23]|uniref:Ankyrin repeat protein n=1 Tax=Metarhizium robertsii (strain ARSEF 23 / ATCC MYA-3075) TaxID=655844 RepID=E9F3X7_METRA|nr:Ankyrin repeat protein [Metarhizium robertsii ARSEF 23]EFY97663.2 Ankyrin repeat protein [Metarhizium robertsii ARSEF 23]